MNARHALEIVCVVVVSATTGLAQFNGTRRGPAGRPAGGPESRGGGHPESSDWGRGGQRGFATEHLFGTILADPDLAKRVGLSGEQLETIKQKLDALRQRSVELKAQLELAGMEQAQIMTAADVDEAALMAAVEKTGRIHTELAKLRVRHLLVIKKNVTTEQLAQVREVVRDKMKEHFRDRYDGGRNRREGGSSDRRWHPSPPHRDDDGAPPPGEDSAHDRRL